MRRSHRVRRPISSKPDTCTEDVAVYAAGISVKVARLTLGGLPICHVLPSLRGGGMNRQKSAEGIVSSSDRAEGPNVITMIGA